MSFTATELAEMAAADAEIEREFRLTADELRASAARDLLARREALPPDKRKLAERKRAYYEANKEQFAEYQRAYRAANKEKLAEYNRAYREANKEQIAEYQRAIKDARRARGYTQRDMARLLGVSQTTVSLFESGALRADWDALCAVLPELKERRPG